MFGLRFHTITGTLTLLLATISAYAQQHDMQWIQRGSASGVTAIRFSADGSSFITYGYQTPIKVWGTATGDLLNVIPYPLNPNVGGYWQSVWYSPRGNYVIAQSGVLSPKLRLYDSRTSELLGGADLTDYLVAISSDEKYLITGTFNSPMRLWSLPSMKEQGSFTPTQAYAISFTPDNKYVLVAKASGFEAYDVATLTAANIFPGGKEGSSSSFGFASNGDVLVGASYRGITFWDFKQAKRSDISFGALWGFDDEHAGVTVADNGSFAAFSKPHQTFGDSLFLIYDINARKWAAHIDFPATGRVSVTGFAFTPDGTALAVASSDNVIRFYDPRTGAVIRRYPNGHSGSALSSVYSADGTFLITGGDSRVCLWNAQSGERLWELAGEVGPVNAVAISADGSRIAASGMVYTPTWTQTPVIRVWESATGTLLQTLPHPTGTVFTLAFTPDGNHLVSGGGDGIVRFWDIVTGNPVQTYIGHGLSVRDVAIDFAGNRIASASDDWTVKLWDISTGALQRTFSGHRGPVNSVVFTPNDAQLISASSDSTLREWTIDNGSARGLRGHDAAVNGAGVSGDGKWIVSAGADGKVNAWDRARGEIVYTYRDSILGSMQSFTSVSIDPQLRSTATTGSDGSVMMWKFVGTFTPLSIPVPVEITESFRLSGSPNPVLHQATVSFTIPEAGNCRLRVVDAQGNEVVELLNNRLPAGPSNHTWNASELPNGAYYYTLVWSDMVMTSSMFTVMR